MRYLLAIVLAACSSSASTPPPAPAPITAAPTAVDAAPTPAPSRNLIGGDAAKRAVIGQELTFSSWGGQKRSDGLVAEADIALVTLGEEKIDGWKRLVYSVDVLRRGRVMYRAYVDPYAGTVIGVYWLFIA